MLLEPILHALMKLVVYPLSARENAAFPLPTLFAFLLRVGGIEVVLIFVTHHKLLAFR